ncbi:MAG: hypothetical protein ACRER2_10155 [Methylococcales bacterium]
MTQTITKLHGLSAMKAGNESDAHDFPEPLHSPPIQAKLKVSFNSSGQCACSQDFAKAPGFNVRKEDGP